MRTFPSRLLLSLCLVTGCNAQSPVADLAQSHIDGNVPDAKVFDEYMRRDLAIALCPSKTSCNIQYELLRKEPTQTGVAYPKFYVWVKATSAKGETIEGAARLAATQKQQFYLTNFLSSEQIRTSPHKVNDLFPAALAGKILDKAKAAK